MPNAYQIQVEYHQSQNYTPTDAMRRWGMANYQPLFTDAFSRPYFHFHGKDFFYDRWNIQKHDDGTETVTLYLKAS